MLQFWRGVCSESENIYCISSNTDISKQGGLALCARMCNIKMNGNE